ncbi:hypothetical protein [Pseudonocardia sp.]|uniref:hypothetical protein n=1 Tax=Pseudonocardia sp. TaxID=60912 RepID=UPI0026091D6A|nr:hypothetical protein [Pseudonocardia sp.]MCW2720154.1 hypothetical protein [Pseudonocardia sp.]
MTNVIGGIGLLMFLVLEGTRGPDSHGQDPKMSARRWAHPLFERPQRSSRAWRKRDGLNRYHRALEIVLIDNVPSGT